MLYERIDPIEDVEEIKEKLRSTVAAQLKIWMDKMGMDVKVLAKRSTVSADTIYVLRSGDRGGRLDSLALLAYAMSIPPAVFLMPVESLITGNGKDK